ncbi:MAG: N-acetyltransferase [Tepidisphaeraceae bacterium]|jgi:putative acetyltransferase
MEDHRLRLREIHLQAFGGRAEEANLVELLYAAGKARPSLVAIVTGDIVAHVVFSPVTIECAPNNFKAVGLGPVAVLPACQRKGIGTRLVRVGLDACLADKIDAIVVLGSPRFYGRFGFRAAKDFGLRNEYVDDGHFMIRELRPDALGDVSGMVRYSPEFRLARCQ